MPKADDFGMREILGVHFDTEFAYTSVRKVSFMRDLCLELRLRLLF